MKLMVVMIAPILHIIASAVRIKGFIKIRLVYIALMALAIGIAMTFVVVGMVGDELAQENYHCGMPIIGAFFFGIFFTAVATPLIVVISYYVNKTKQRRVFKVS